ncbi:MAG TPA: glucosidase [Thermoanaerobaculia bacterium]|nr:glucosidase [Thermoanaerobaculia bacterium]
MTGRKELSPADAERERLAAADRGEAPWRRWGPYLAERQWGTVREDYSPHGSAWDYLPHDHARSRAYRWGEDGLAGLCDDRQLLCLALALWNGRDPILKERAFGLAGPEGNHGEDVKEQYYYLDATPTSSYLQMLYKYPQAEFPYAWLVAENRRRGKQDAEFELLDTGIFDGDRYFDVFVEYAKAAPEDIFLQVTAWNRGPETAPLHLLPQLWFRNTWSWGRSRTARPVLAAQDGAIGGIRAEHPELGVMWLEAAPAEISSAAEGTPPAAPAGLPELLFCDNDTNVRRLYGEAAATGAVGARGGGAVSAWFKDGFHQYLVHGDAAAVNPAGRGTKAAAHYRLSLPAGGSARLRLRLSRERRPEPFADFGAVLALRSREAGEFYSRLPAAAAQDGTSPDPAAAVEADRVRRQALAGLLWSRQFYYFDVPQWLEGDPGQPPPPAERRGGRNNEWFHLNNADVLSMPDTWEYPWYAAWDLAFHCLPLARLDPTIAKEQLVLLAREWYMHPNGQLPAYEWAFGDVNPPVHAWAALRVFEIDRGLSGRPDHAFLERVFHKLMLNFTWWVNRKDVEGRNVFQGGFLGLDNIGVFDRSSQLPTGGHIDQADGTGWMAMYSLNLLRIALELAQVNPVYEDIATKFFEHFLYVAAALSNLGGQGVDFFDDEDRFYYDVLHLPDGRLERLRVRSMVGLVPLFAVEVLDSELLDRVPGFRDRLLWFLDYRPDLARLVSRFTVPGMKDRHLLSLLRRQRLRGVLSRMLDEQEFLSPYGVRALSRHHRDHPYSLEVGGERFSVSYQPGESESGLFGGNSNWRGPIWFPVNYLIVEALRRFHGYYGDDFKIECPTGSGNAMTLAEVAAEIARRLGALFLPDAAGRRPVFGYHSKAQDDPRFRDYLLFHEYFHGDRGWGLGAAHQTGWTALVADLLPTGSPPEGGAKAAPGGGS